METYNGGLAQSVSHYYAGDQSTPKANTQYTKKKKSLKGDTVACKKGAKKRGKGSK